MKIAFLLHFLTVEIETHSERLYQWLANSYASLDQRSAFSGRESTYHLAFEEAGSSHALEIESLLDGILTEYSLGFGPCYYTPARFYSGVNTAEYNHEIQYDLASRRLKANIGKGYVQSEENFIYTIFRPLLRNFLLPFHGLKTLHGAVLTREDQAVFLYGAGGAGKTTLALQMMADGFSMLSEDSPFITRQDGGNVVALSSLDHPRVTEGTLALFPEYRSVLRGPCDISGKFAIDRFKLPPDKWATGPMVVRDIICLARAPGNALALVPMAKQALLATLLRESMVLFREPVFHQEGLPFQEMSRCVFEWISDFVNQANVYTLTYADEHLRDISGFLKVRLAKSKKVCVS